MRKVRGLDDQDGCMALRINRWGTTGDKERNGNKGRKAPSWPHEKAMVEELDWKRGKSKESNMQWDRSWKVEQWIGVAWSNAVTNQDPFSRGSSDITYDPSVAATNIPTSHWSWNHIEILWNTPGHPRHSITILRLGRASSLTVR